MVEEKRKMLTLAQRAEITDLMLTQKIFTAYIQAVKFATGKSDKEIDKMDNNEIYEIGNQIIEENNFSKKKLSNAS